MKEVIFVPHWVVPKNTDFWCGSGVLNYFIKNSKHLNVDVRVTYRRCSLSVLHLHCPLPVQIPLHMHKNIKAIFLFLNPYLFIIVRLLQSIVMVNGEWLWNPRVLVERRQLIWCNIHTVPWQSLLFTLRQMHWNKKTLGNRKKVKFLSGDIILNILFILPFSSEIIKRCQ